LHDTGRGGRVSTPLPALELSELSRPQLAANKVIH